jgi:hypothetical protein
MTEIPCVGGPCHGFLFRPKTDPPPGRVIFYPPTPEEDPEADPGAFYYTYDPEAKVYRWHATREGPKK